MSNIQERRELIQRVISDLEKNNDEAIILECNNEDLLMFEIMFKVNGLNVERFLYKAVKLEHSLLITKNFH